MQKVPFSGKSNSDFLRKGVFHMTELVKGLAIGMVAGATVGALVAMPKKRGSAMGKMLKTAGHIVENISDAIGI